MTMGSIMFYGGIAGVAVSAILAIIFVNLFPRQRKKMLEKLSE